MRTGQLKTIKISENDVLSDQKINNPDNLVDFLPMPYSLIDEVLNETIIFQLNLKMHELEEKKKNSNYQGTVKQYLAQNTMDIQGISCLSQPQKSHNHLIAGDKNGNVFLLDLAKKAIFSKKEIVPNKRVNKITDSFITDGDSIITTAAIIFQGHHSIYIVRYKHSQPKIYLTHEIKIASDSLNPNLLPFDCELYDYCRLLTVKTYNGNILAFRIPQILLDVDSSIKGTPVPLQEEDIKKILKYPLSMSKLQGQMQVIEQKVLQINFPGDRVLPKYNDLKAKLLKKKEPVIEEGKKQPKKKQQKKMQSEKQIPQQEYNFNLELQFNEADKNNGMDESKPYILPQYQPFVYLSTTVIPLPKNRYFQRSKTVSLVNTIIYGWKNTKYFKIGTVNEPVLSQIPEYLYLIYHQQKLKQQEVKQLQQYMNSQLKIKKQKEFKNVHNITSSEISKTDFALVAFGLQDGTISMWNPLSLNLQFNTEKHSSSVTCIRFFQKWKMISGSSTGQVFIHNLFNHKNQVKRTNTFQPKVQLPITDIQVNELGIAHVIDSSSNMRVFDLWRNQKIAKFHPCTPYAVIDNKGKKWFSSQKVGSHILYTNRDFTAIISMNWPNFSLRVQDRTEEEKEKLELLTSNPWKSKGTNLHVVRNFELLLSLFEGLQSTYKKGYERKKIQNLFSNLEFSQLFDRNFQIPDFGHPPGMKKNESHTNTKSLFSGVKSNQRSQRSLKSNSKSKDKSKNNTSEGGKHVKLTNEVLHPEKFLLERRKINKDLMITSESFINWLRQSHFKKEHRQNKLMTEASKGIF